MEITGRRPHTKTATLPETEKEKRRRKRNKKEKKKEKGKKQRHNKALMTQCTWSHIQKFDTVADIDTLYSTARTAKPTEGVSEQCQVIQGGRGP